MYERNGRYYTNFDGEEIECLPPEEQKMMAEDFQGWLKWKKDQLEKKGYVFEDEDEDYEDLKLEDEQKKRRENLEKAREAFKRYHEE